jgi:hypothetical protein
MTIHLRAARCKQPASPHPQDGTTKVPSRPRSRVRRGVPIPTSVTLPVSTATRLRHLARRLHGLGERPIYEFLAEIVQGADIMARLECYAALDPDTVRALGGDELPNQLFVLDGDAR